MIGVIDNYDFKEMEPMRYWSPPASWDYEKKKTTTQQRIFSGDWWAAEKKDGYFAKFVKDEDGNIKNYQAFKNASSVLEQYLYKDSLKNAMRRKKQRPIEEQVSNALKEVYDEYEEIKEA